VYILLHVSTCFQVCSDELKASYPIASKWEENLPVNIMVIFDPQVYGLFKISALNILWAMMSGTRYARENEEVQELLRGLDIIFRSGTQSGRLTDMFPILKRFLPQSMGYKQSLDTIINLQNFLKVCSNKNWWTIIIIIIIIIIVVEVVVVVVVVVAAVAAAAAAKE
jgi:hypothetical protein